MTDYQGLLAEGKTLLDFLRFAITHFEANELWYGHGTDNPWDEAMSLIRFALFLPEDCPREILNATLLSSEKEQLLDLFKTRIEERLPVPYITHKAHFAGLTFYVDQRVLIPRSPLAEVIEQQFSPWFTGDGITRICDLGTGSGCIAISAAFYCPDALVDAVDPSEDALDVAAKNIADFGMEGRVQLIEGDGFENCDTEGYDIIISNPPYVGQTEIDALPPEYKHEPQMALAGGDFDGLALVDDWLRVAGRYLKPGGILVLEVGASAEALIQRFPSLPFVWLHLAKGGEGEFVLTAEDLWEAFPDSKPLRVTQHGE